ncbi:MAG: hypothetical protein J07HX5_00134 [halophilic archaeon J07HX5]|jgi:hypothetical protein|nr:MAG: hypothetical protein J07HX5_00134 [halophilic archaeon J07HX5]
MNADETIAAYYDALRAGEPLGPYFAEGQPDDDALVKYGLSERLVGDTEIRAGLRRQTETTTDWAVTSHALQVCSRDTHGWFSDTVSMAWTDIETAIRYEFETRWSGTLAQTADDGGLSGCTSAR